jgi:hypothetical protein
MGVAERLFMITLHLPAYVVGNRQAGVGVRAWELAQALAPHLPVRIVARGEGDLSCANVDFVEASDWTGRRRALEEAAAVVFFDLPDTAEMLRMDAIGKVIISENAPPLEHLEYHAVRSAGDPDRVHRLLVAAYELQVLLSDQFLVQSSAARVALISSLCHLGRLARANYEGDPTLDRLTSWMPVGFSLASAEAARNARPSMSMVDFTWSGGLWDFYDPVAVVRAVELLDKMGRSITVRFLYPPPADQVLAEAKELARSIVASKVGHLVEILERPPRHQDRCGALLSGRATICIGKPGIENLTCVRLRLRDTLLYAKPLLVDEFGATAEVVRSLGIGTVVDPRHPRDLAEAMYRLARQEDLRAGQVKRIREVRRQFTLDQFVPKLVSFVRRGERAADARATQRQRRVNEILERFPELRRSAATPW